MEPQTSVGTSRVQCLAQGHPCRQLKPGFKLPTLWSAICSPLNQPLLPLSSPQPWGNKLWWSWATVFTLLVKFYNPFKYSGIQSRHTAAAGHCLVAAWSLPGSGGGPLSLAQPDCLPEGKWMKDALYDLSFCLATLRGRVWHIAAATSRLAFDFLKGS